MEFVRWVTNQNTRNGSCTPSNAAPSASHRLATMRFVLDYCLCTSLHLLEANHGPRFWKLVSRFPRSERAVAISWQRSEHLDDE